MQPLSFARHRFSPQIIRHAIWLYARFTLSFRDVEDLLAERVVDVSYETIRRWVLKFGLSIAANIRRSRPRPSDHWHLDEMAITIRGERFWLWRAVDNEGEVLDFLVQRRRNAKAARELMTKLLKKQGLRQPGSSPIVYDPIQRPSQRWASVSSMIEICVPTTGRRTRTNRSGEESANSSGSSQQVRPNAF